jgi:hypothetical protein
MLKNNRILFYRQSAFVDASTALSDVNEYKQVFDFTAPGDSLYLGSDLPFNHKYFLPDAVNDVASVVSVDLWSGNEWIPAVDIQDETSDAGVSLSRGGIISWTPDWDLSSWGYDDTDEMDGTDLENGPKIYGLYWARLKWSVTLNTATELKYVGHRFCSETDLETEYPELASPSIKTAWESGKTSWDDQILTASEYIIQDLRGMKNLIESPSQILDWHNFQKAAVHKTAQIIFRGFGDDYKDQYIDSAQTYRSSLNVGKFNVDLNRNATLDAGEKVTNVNFGKR